MKWHLHKWQLTGWLSWIIKISTLILACVALSATLKSGFDKVLPDLFPLILLGLIFIHYFYQFLISLRSKEYLSSIGNFIIILSTIIFGIFLYTSGGHFLVAMFAFVMITAEAIYVLFYYLNTEHQPLYTSRVSSLWIIGISLLLFGLLVISIR